MLFRSADHKTHVWVCHYQPVGREPLVTILESRGPRYSFWSLTSDSDARHTLGVARAGLIKRLWGIKEPLDLPRVQNDRARKAESLEHGNGNKKNKPDSAPLSSSPLLPDRPDTESSVSTPAQIKEDDSTSIPQVATAPQAAPTPQQVTVPPVTPASSQAVPFPSSAPAPTPCETSLSHVEQLRVIVRLSIRGDTSSEVEMPFEGCGTLKSLLDEALEGPFEGRIGTVDQVKAVWLKADVKSDLPRLYLRPSKSENYKRFLQQIKTRLNEANERDVVVGAEIVL